MIEIDFSQKISENTNIEELNTKTLSYRVNGVIRACNYCLDDCESIKHIDVSRDNFGKTRFIYDNKNDLTVFASKIFSNNGFLIHVEGNYENLDFSINNYIGKKNLDKKIREIPFSFYIKRYLADSIYEIHMNTAFEKEVHFVFIKDNKKMCFNANVLEFANILNLIKTFVINPEIVFNKYEEIIDNKRIMFTNGELNKPVETYEEFEKPASKLVKKIKKITNSH